MKILKHWQMLILAIALILAITSILTLGIPLGLDFGGGTRFELELQDVVSQEEISRIANIISIRIDPSGLRDYTIFPVGGQFITIQMSETDTAELERIETRIRQQGKFEANLNGEVVFTGDEIRRVLRGDNSFGIYRVSGNNYEWSLPFVLNSTATQRFTKETFHQCSATSFDPSGKPIYDCESTIFFLDKPEALIIISQNYYEDDSELLFVGNRFLNIPAQTEIDDVIDDSILDVIIFDGNIDRILLEQHLENNDDVIISNDLDNNLIVLLEEIGFNVIKRERVSGEPWIWNVLNARQIISLTPGITNQNVEKISQAQQFSTLRISGQRNNAEEAFEDLEELAILLESGSLPTPVKSISRETISPSLGEAFLANVFLMGLIAILMVGIVIVIRYRIIKLAIPIFVIAISEIVILLGFIAWAQRPLDLAAFAGIIAAIGTGIDSEIVITDELLGKGKNVKEALITRVKSALFIIMTAVFTMIGVMGPIVLLRSSLLGLDKLYGFAVVAIVGGLIGVFITRPAFTKIIEKIIEDLEKKEDK
jgi:preprotein translocase subunit SecD